MIMSTEWPPHDIEHYEVKWYPIYAVQYFWVIKVQSISLYSHPFSRYRSVWDNSTEWLQTDLEHYEVESTSVPHIYSTSTLKSQFSLRLWGEITKKMEFFIFPLANVKFQSFFKQVYRITPQRPHTCDTSTPRSQVSIRLVLGSGLFEWQTISRQMHQMTPKWPQTLKG